MHVLIVVRQNGGNIPPTSDVISKKRARELVGGIVRDPWPTPISRDSAFLHTSGFIVEGS